MATIKCSSCNVNESITFCSETGLPLCGDCATSCDVCFIALERKRVHLTSTGRTLCKKCMAERNARRKARQEKPKREDRSSSRSKPRKAAPAAPEASAPKAAGVPGGGAGMSFEDLMEDQPPAPVAPPPEESLAPAESDSETRDFGMEGMPGEGSSRLELPPIDEERPVLTGSGYNPPSKKAYFLAYVFFGVAGVAFFISSPGLRELMWPFTTPGLEFQSDARPMIMETNQLRGISNASQLEIFEQGPTFFITWLLLITYLGGSALIIWSTFRSAVSSFLARRRLKKAEKEAGLV